MANKTSIREFEYDKDIFFEIVRTWALIANFEVKEKRDGYRLYRKSGFGLGNDGWLLAQHDGKMAHLEAWLGPRNDGNFLKGEKMSLESSYIGGVPKAQYREIFNKLLDMLEEPRL